MARFDECCVLIPSATLEDFPSNTSDFDARSMLAGWTVLWHPSLLAQSEQLPTWYRADSPPDLDGPRIVAVPTMSVDQLPGEYESNCRKDPNCHWVSGETREQMLQALQLQELPTLQSEHRAVGVRDFFAAGFVSLQVQVMTRRLRYTSNLDEIHLQSRVVAAAQAFCGGDAKAAIEALHDVFDCLAEERDHYFSSDPHLIDLNLLTPATLDTFVDQHLAAALQANQPGNSDQEPILQTPTNVLIDHPVAAFLIRSEVDRYRSFRDSLASGQIGWAGGDPEPEICIDAMSFDQADRAIRSAFKTATEAVGQSPRVYARREGATPADLTPTIASLGYQGMIPIDFSRGSGFGDEAKVIRQAGGVEIQALTAKPIDAGSDASFLDLGARLGEAIDSGEIATALLVHWPGGECESFADLKTAASWSLALGRFWKLDDYFTDGEHPYHHGTARALSPEASITLTHQVDKNAAHPLSSVTTAFRDCVASETARCLRGMTGLVAGKPIGLDGADQLKSIAIEFARTSGAQPSSAEATSVLCINPQGAGCRETIRLAGAPPASSKHIYATSSERSESVISLDVPAYGFARAETGKEARKRKSLIGRLFSSGKQIAEGHSLSNKFMEAVISPKTGGIQGVYSGAVRGNRLSLRLVQVCSHVDDEKSADDGAQMVADKVRIVNNSESAGEIQANGKLIDHQSNTIATFTLNYRLQRGSRHLHVSGSLKPAHEVKGDPWQNYLGIRVAYSSEAAIIRPLVRDKIHRSRSRRVVAPLGLVIDEAERQTLISAGGMAYHRRVGDRFVDTLFAVQGETVENFQLAYGFDVPTPVATAKAMIAEPPQVSIEKTDQLPLRGWIAHVAPAEVLITRLELAERDDGRLAAMVRLIQTRSRSAKVKLRFCRDLQFATLLKGNDVDSWNLPIPANDDGQQTHDPSVKCEGDSIQFSVASHQITNLLAVFAAREQPAATS
jgi:alpha-mannosidase